MTDRGAFLGRIRAETARARGLVPGGLAPQIPGGLAPQGPGGLASRPSHPREIAETLRRELAERWRETLERFRTEFERVAGVYHRVATAGEVPGVIGEIARERQARTAIAWHPSALGVDWSEALSARGLATVAMPAAGIEPPAERQALRDLIAAADLGVTGVDLAVAETGSLVLLSGSGRPRSTSLLPPYHVAVFDRDTLVESLAQVGVFLEAWHDGVPEAWRGGVINVITGPSRTADIELTLTRGVHGPEEVHAIFVEGGLRA
jgi:L-lactate dehydrogenase complex protein LldG